MELQVNRKVDLRCRCCHYYHRCHCCHRCQRLHWHLSKQDFCWNSATYQDHFLFLGLKSNARCSRICWSIHQFISQFSSLSFTEQTSYYWILFFKFRYILKNYFVGFLSSQDIFIQRIMLISNARIIYSSLCNLQINFFLQIPPYFARRQKIFLQTWLFWMRAINFFEILNHRCHRGA